MQQSKRVRHLAANDVPFCDGIGGKKSGCIDSHGGGIGQLSCFVRWFWKIGRVKWCFFFFFFSFLLLLHTLFFYLSLQLFYLFFYLFFLFSFFSCLNGSLFGEFLESSGDRWEVEKACMHAEEFVIWTAMVPTRRMKSIMRQWCQIGTCIMIDNIWCEAT